MKTKTKLIQLGVLCLLLSRTSALADFTYMTVNGQITITGYSGLLTNPLVIPDSINGLPVTDISPQAFYPNTTLTNVVVPSGVTNIESGAFEYCRNLLAITVNTNNPDYASISGVLFNKNLTALLGYPNGLVGTYIIPGMVTSIGDAAFYASGNLPAIAIPDGVTNIGASAFGSCNNLTNVAIGSGVMSIGASAFGNCSKLTSISVNTTNSTYSATAGVLFNKSQSTLIEYPQGLAVPYVIPGTVNNVGDNAFTGSQVAGVTIPFGVTNIGANAFGYCEGLTNVVIPDSVSDMGTMAFQNCFNLASVVVSTNITSLSDDVFFDGFSLTNVNIPSGVTSIGDSAFYYCRSLANVTLPGSLTNL